MDAETKDWKLRFERERASRKEAESILEDKSIELYNLNQTLKKRIDIATKDLSFTLDTLNRYVIMSKTDKKGIITYVSDAFCKISGYAKEELIGQPHSIVRHPNSSEYLFKELWSSIKSNNSWEGQIQNKKKDGSSYWVETTISKNIDIDGNEIGYISVRQDVSNARKVEEQQEQLLNQSRHAAMGEMISMIAHQWRQPIASISSIATNNIVGIDFNTLDLSDVLQSQTEITELCIFMSKTIDDFREFFKPNKEKELVYIEKVITKSINYIDNILKNHSIILNVDINEVDQVLIFKSEMIQVILNILKNSIDAFEKNQSNKVISITSLKNTTHHRLLLSDNGEGIPEKILPKLFEPYFSTKSKNGTGLGLYMSKTIIEEHLDGKINAYNNDQGGATFEIQLPIVSN